MRQNQSSATPLCHPSLRIVYHPLVRIPASALNSSLLQFCRKYVEDLLDVCVAGLDVCTAPPTLNYEWIQRNKELSLCVWVVMELSLSEDF